MSLLTRLLEELADCGERRSLFERDFMGEEFLNKSSYSGLPFRSGGHLRPWRFSRASNSGISSVINNKQLFKVCLDVQQFKPEDLKVKIADGFLVVEAAHEERSDEHGFVSRQFTRRYKLGEDVDSDALTSTLSSDGVLILEAPKIAMTEENVRQIPITQTNEPANKQEEPKEKMED